MTQFDFDRSSAFPAPEDSPGFLLWHVSTLWRRAIEGVLKPLGLTHPQFVILATVGWLTRSDQSATQAAIGRQASLDPNTTSQILRGLQAKDLIERSRTIDERSKCSSLTPKGSQKLAEALPAVEKADAHFFAALNLSEINAIEALQRLANLKSDSAKNH
ncbi:putative Uncharacterized HTH-type transcriptional regulator ydcH [Candidatus Protochlamydia naegleriophila]|uniref:Putative Uncharacterized HTH-type transcriptional regulator ydcH n=1 Tax=Candidatus Protochlamydia naegleriophila TaxID=389348 RepID=A0A0U5EPW1_9BACT|nr:winged helix DNA-binding protein [Candidatus Protochlamydia naegleriophila]CUI16128.1 putative Uncharacterized HTH-type transcriptional regulator ydcH [Candidatus Protochlamydia naegleriophila]